MAQKKIPIRKCVGCGEGKPKRELIRIVRTAQGEISFDETGRKSGRGAYLCKDVACLEKARKKRSLERAFSADAPAVIPPEVYEALISELESADDR